MRGLVLSLIMILLLPFYILGLIIFTWRVRRVIIPNNISGTAAEPYGARLLMHLAGTRIDEAAYEIAEHTPLYAFPVNFLMLQTTSLALKISGYKGSLFAYPGTLPSSTITMMSHRSYFYDCSVNEALARTENPIEQLVILGVGYDTRCYDLPIGSDPVCYAVDMAPTLTVKKKALEKSGIPHSHVTFVETDFNQETWLDALLASGFDSGKTTYILWEGVTMYLTDEAINATLELFSGLPSGSIIGADFFTEDVVKGNPPHEAWSKRIHSSIKYYSEKIMFGIPTGTSLSEGSEKLAAKHGLALTKFDNLGDRNDKKKVPWYVFTEMTKK
ncbi:SAM-dependent methyltransferase [Gammaproteobacteria bacterium]|nr:SAM-dependent methyltransferase [Gammaproteobacteria bacterium]